MLSDFDRWWGVDLWDAVADESICKVASLDYSDPVKTKKEEEIRNLQNVKIVYQWSEAEWSRGKIS